MLKGSNLQNKKKRKKKREKILQNLDDMEIIINSASTKEISYENNVFFLPSVGTPNKIKKIYMYLYNIFIT